MIYVDHNYHLTASTLPELHDFAGKLGISHNAFSRSVHASYDVTGRKRTQILFTGLVNRVQDETIEGLSKGLTDQEEGKYVIGNYYFELGYYKGVVVLDCKTPCGRQQVCHLFKGSCGYSAITVVCGQKFYLTENELSLCSPGFRN